MFRTAIITIGVLTVGLCVPVHGQDYSKLNFNIGGGVSTPLNPTGSFAGVSGNFAVGAGYNIDKRHSVIGEFMWSGLPPNRFALQPINAPFGNVNLYTLTANYRYHLDKIGGSAFGAYVIAGGGWYFRHASIDKNYVVPPNTVCEPVFTWWGFVCDSGGFVVTQTIASKGASAGGVNAGVGFTIRIGDSGWKFYTESRYHYAWTNRTPTTLIPVTFGIRLN
ncbi:MAG TPA: outer membrane beta-barrel protein [Bryobacteraceae bacterium]|nr:outer membrane beta-barrel protein [Bryobacteraceae bacterium]